MLTSLTVLKCTNKRKAIAALLLSSGLSIPAFATNSEVPTRGTDSSIEQVEKSFSSKISNQIFQTSESVVQQVSEHTTGLISTAIGLLGIPYLRGGNSIESGFDCSGFVRYIFKETVGLVLPRSADQQATVTQRIDKSELKPGDLVFFNTMKRAFSHVGVYVGEGKFIHAPRSGASVRIEDMGIPYWKLRFDGARRVQANDTLNNSATPLPVQ